MSHTIFNKDIFYQGLRPETDGQAQNTCSSQQRIDIDTAGIPSDQHHDYANQRYKQCIFIADLDRFSYINILETSCGMMAITWIIFFLPDVSITTSTGDNFGALLYPVQMAAASWMDALLAPRGTKVMGLA
jgi:hypothetical protein